MKDEAQAYQADPNIDPSGTSFHDHTVLACYDQLVAILGPHNCDGDDYKVTTEWIVKGPNGEALTVYDWKETDRYDSDQRITVRDVRDWITIRWHIGARKAIDALMFKDWLNERMEDIAGPPCVACGGYGCDGHCQR